ncbi:MAG: ArsR family transcriptional regulator [Elusimicrobia bacterium]|nr:ArsR family transcriptional regulator [Elusimicrobiota bacterium]
MNLKKTMAKKTLISYVLGLGRPVFSARELSAVSGKSPSTVSQGLAFLRGQGLVVKVAHGVWAAGGSMPGPYAVITHILPKQRAYVSFTSALYLHGIIEQIPQYVTLASVAHSGEIKTGAGMFTVHRLSPSFFCGFGWREGAGGFLLAEPEKALVDCLYVSAFRKRQFSHFPELRFSAGFSFRKAYGWVAALKSRKAAAHARRRLDLIAEAARLRRGLKKSGSRYP